MKFSGTITNINNIEFAIVKVSSKNITNSLSIARTQTIYSKVFDDLPIILACRNNFGNISYFGNSKITNVIPDNFHNELSWKVYSL